MLVAMVDTSSSASSCGAGNENSCVRHDGWPRRLTLLARRRSLIGDAWCLTSAVIYALYTIMLKIKLKEDDSEFSMPLLFGTRATRRPARPPHARTRTGLIGTINALVFWPGFILLHFTGVEPFVWPSGRVVSYLLVNGFFGSVVSDFLWARSVLLTTPVIATLGLTMTIPMALLVDAVVNGRKFNGMYAGGSLLVVLGFVMVNLKHKRDLDVSEAAGEAGAAAPALPVNTLLVAESR